uniref:Uncharacterized protein n=1 Tax=Lotus japonicus TaxID=34305 RepID=I3SLD4_LOTJA|nr:unknown [Lotus japonicus]
MVGQELLLFQGQSDYQDFSLLFPALQQRLGLSLLSLELAPALISTFINLDFPRRGPERDSDPRSGYFPPPIYREPSRVRGTLAACFYTITC